MGDEKDPAKTADESSGGWTVESHSVVENPPEDTTRRAAEPAPEPPDATGDDNEPPAGHDDDEGEEHAGEAEPPQQTGPPKSHQTRRREKKSERYRENERLREAAERRAADLERQNQQFLARLEALEKGKPAASAPKPSEKPGETGAAMPRLSDFDTEDEFNAALDTWLSARDAARDTKLKADVESGLDARLKRERAEDEGRRQEAAFVDRLTAMNTAHPDLAEKIAPATELLERITPKDHPFLFDVIQSTETGPELLYRFVDNPAILEALSELPVPTRAVRDAVVTSPVADRLMEYFATPEGEKDFLRLRQLHPLAVIREVGRLEAYLDAVDRGSAPGAPHAITKAAPPARPPVGSPRARPSERSSGAPTTSFEDWMKDEDDKERKARLRAAGAPA